MLISSTADPLDPQPFIQHVRRDESGAEVATGVYFARLTVDSQSASSKMVLLK